MINIEFNRTLNTDVLTVRTGTLVPEDDFTLKMLRNSSLPQLLKPDVEFVNGESVFNYDIASKQPFDKVYFNGSINRSVLTDFLSALIELSKVLNDYLLDIKNVLMRSECIFTDLDKREYFFCLCPGAQDSFSSDLTGFCDRLLSLLDYSDQEAVACGFSLNRLAHSENFSFSRLEDLLGQAKGEETDTPFFNDPSIRAVREAKEDDPWAGIFEDPEPEVKTQEIKNNREKLSGKLKNYFHGKNFKEVYNDINSGAIFKKIKNTEKPIKMPEASGSSDTGCSEDTGYITGFSFPESDALIFMEDVQYVDASTENTTDLSGAAGKEHTLTGIGAASGKQAFIGHFPYTIGKLANEADFDPGSKYVSRLHGRINREGTEGNYSYSYEDLNSRNGSLINDRRVSAYVKTPLSPGDVLTLADMEFLFR